MRYNYNYEGGTYVAATDNSSWNHFLSVVIVMIEVIADDDY